MDGGKYHLLKMIDLEFHLFLFAFLAKIRVPCLLNADSSDAVCTLECDPLTLLDVTMVVPWDLLKTFLGSSLGFPICITFLHSCVG